MASEASAQVLAAAGIFADPYFWTSAAALFLGLAAGQGIKACGGGSGRGRRGRRIARALCFLSLAILGLAGFLVLADGAAFFRTGLFGGQAPALLAWAALIAALSCLAGLRPLAAGLPIAVLGLAVFVFSRLALEGWAPLRPLGGAPARIASFLPYGIAPSAVRGHLELFNRDSAPIAQDLALDGSGISLSVECLFFAGPLGFLAELATPQESPPPTSPTPRVDPRRFFRVVGVNSPGGGTQSFATPAHVALIDTLLPLPAGAGTHAEGASRSALFGLARRSRQSSEAAALVALEPLIFTLDDAGKIVALAP